MAGGENRKRLKKLLGKILGSSNQNDSPPVEAPKGRDQDTAPPKAVVPSQNERTKEKVTPKETINSTSPPPPKNKSESKPISEDKVAKHWKKAKKGVLKKAKELGSNASLADLHNHSEKRYFIGHQRFSQLMEELVEEELIDYDWEAQEANITPKGIDFMNG